jgi:Na+-transporting methylmalonyl-CoA/oxaloacetate decarboxylase gamma subunit
MDFHLIDLDQSCADDHHRRQPSPRLATVRHRRNGRAELQRAECLYHQTRICLLINTSASPFLIFTIASCGFVLLVLSTLFLVIFIAKLAARCIDEARTNPWVDSGEFARSIVFSLKLTTTWQMIASLIATIDADEVFGPIGAICGACPVRTSPKLSRPCELAWLLP